MWESDSRENKMERIFALYSSQRDKGRHSCMLGIGLCYCGAQKQEVLDSPLYAWKECSIPPNVCRGEYFDPMGGMLQSHSCIPRGCLLNLQLHAVGKMD